MSDDGYTRITLRIPDELHALLTAEAAKTSKSMNAEIIARLNSTFDRRRTDTFNRDILDDVVFREIEREEQEALNAIDRNTVAGLVQWLELVDEFAEKKQHMEDMIEEALAIYERRRLGKESGNGEPKKKAR